MRSRVKVTTLKSYLVCLLVICHIILTGLQALATDSSTIVIPVTKVAQDTKTGLTESTGEEPDKTNSSMSETVGNTIPKVQQETAEPDNLTKQVPVTIEAKDTVKKDRVSPKASEPETDKKSDEGLSSLQWLGIGAGVAAISIVGIAVLAGSSSSDSSSSYPSEENIVGNWRGQGTCLEDGRTYDGTYTFYAGGTHTYNLLLSDGAVHQGNGTWILTAGSYAFEIHNASGSAYRGNFSPGSYESVTLHTTDGRWMVTLTKK